MTSSALVAHLSIFLLPVIGVAIGALTERLAAMKLFMVNGRICNTAVKLYVASLVWTQFVSIELSPDRTNVCILPTVAPLLYTQNNFEYEQSIDINGFDTCTPKQGIKIIVVVLLKCLMLYVSTNFGASLQPIGLTGGIACGKSTVCKLLAGTSESDKKDAFAIVDLDEIAHDILVPGKMKDDCVYKRVVSAFEGEDILDKGRGKKAKDESGPAPIDRRKLGDIIFRDEAKRKKLNSITHPVISKVMMKKAIREYFHPSSDKTATVAVDVPLLFEVGLKLKLLLGLKVVVACTPELQLERMIRRDPDLTAEQCNKRIQSQIPIDKKVHMGDIVIRNDGTLDDLIKEVEAARKEILLRKKGYFGITLHWLIAISGAVTTVLSIYDISRM